MISKGIYKNLFLIVLFASMVVLGYLQYNLNHVEKNLINNAFESKEEEVNKRMNSFFLRITDYLKIVKRQYEFGKFKDIDVKGFNHFFEPFTITNSRITSIIMANEKGEELMMLKTPSGIYNRRTTVNEGVFENIVYKWKQSSNAYYLKELEENASLNYSPLERPWFKGALLNSGKIHWTDPYILFTTRELGITASVSFYDSDSTKCILAFDLLLKDLCQFISELKIDENGEVFLLTNNLELIGFKSPDREDFSSFQNELLVPVSESQSVVRRTISKYWEKKGRSEEAFILFANEDYWMGSVRPFHFNNLSLRIGLVALKRDFERKLNQTRYVMAGGQLLTLLFMVMMVRGYRKEKVTNALLKHRKKLLEEKNREIAKKSEMVKLTLRSKVDSIRYAKRLQDAMLPSPELRKELFPESFIFFKPKDLVSGDFYWMKRVGERKVFAVVDCTGHGVPGAMMSMLGHSFLEEIVGKKNITRPALILNKLRNLIILALKQSDKGGHADGMDIAIIVHDEPTGEILFAGANNPMYHVNKKGLAVFSPDKMSIGYEYRALKSYSTQKVKVKEGDMIYLFTDGFVDQIGGPQDRKYMFPKFRKVLESIHDMPLAAQYSILENEFVNWRGSNDQIDDICVVGIRF